MGHSQSKLSKYHPSSAGSPTNPSIVAEHPEHDERHSRPRSSIWFKSPRSRFLGKQQDPLSFSDTIPKRQFIPRAQRKRSAGPIRTRPEPSEYVSASSAAAFLSPLDSGASQSTEPAVTLQPPNDAGNNTFPTAWKSLGDGSDARSRRKIGHRVCAPPSYPPLPEEPESVRSHHSHDGINDIPATTPSPSDHGHEPVPISPSLALALKAGLGSGSFARSDDGQIVAHGREDPNIATGMIEFADESHPSAQSEETARRWSTIPCGEGWQSDWEDLRHLPSYEGPLMPAFAAQGHVPLCRFSSPSSNQPTTSSSAQSPRGQSNSGTQSLSETDRRGSSSPNSPFDPQCASHHASDSRDSPRHSFPTVLRDAPPDTNKASPKARLSLGSDDSLVASRAGPSRSDNRREDPSATRMTSPQLHPNSIKANDNTFVQRAFDRCDEPAPNTAAESRRSSMLQSVYSDAAQSGRTSSATKEVEKLRQGPELNVHEDSIDGIFEGKGLHRTKRPKALSLIGKLRSMTGRRSEPLTPASNMANAEVQASAPYAQTTLRTRLRALSSHAPAGSVSGADSARPLVANVRSQSQPHVQPTATGNSKAGPFHSTGSAEPRSTQFEQGSSANGTRTRFQSDATTAEQDQADATRQVVYLSRGTRSRIQRSLRSSRSFTSSGSSLRTRFRTAQRSAGGVSEYRSKPAGGLSAPLWWHQNHLKHKGSEGIAAEAQAAKLGRRGSARGADPNEDNDWVDMDHQDDLLTTVQNPAVTPTTPTSNKHTGGFWIWPRKLASARVRGFASDKDQTQSSQPESHEHGLASDSREGEAEQQLAVQPSTPADGLPINTSAAVSYPGFLGLDARSSSANSFTSLAQPPPLAPLPPLRPQRRISATKATESDLGSNAASSDVLHRSVEAPSSSSKQRSQHQHSYSNESDGVKSDTMTASGTGFTMPSTAATSEGMATSPAVATSHSRATSVQSDHSKRQDAAYNLSSILARYSGPSVPPTSRVRSDISDAGTQENLLSDHEPPAFLNPGSERQFWDPTEAQNLHRQSFVPASSASPCYERSATSETASALSPPIEEGAGRMSAPGAPLHGAGSAARLLSPHIRDSGFTEGSRSSCSALSYSSGSRNALSRLRDHRNRSSFYSEELDAHRRSQSYGSGSFVTADPHSRYASMDQTLSPRIDGLPMHDTQLSPLMLVGMVAAASSPIEGTMAGNEHAAATTPLTSPIISRPLPSIPLPSIDSTLFMDLSQRRSFPFLAGTDEGCLLPSPALYEHKHQRHHPQSLPPTLRQTSGLRTSWTPADGPWSADIVTPKSTFGRVRGLARPERRITERDVLRSVFAREDRGGHAREEQHPIPSTARTDLEDDAELTRLEEYRAGSRILSPDGVSARPVQSDAADHVERAPFADTGVQASLAALRALESPGQSVRTILARLRMFGEPDQSVAEFLKDSRLLSSAESQLDEEEALAVSGPRRRRRAAPYPRAGDLLYSSDDLSSGRSLSSRRADLARRRRQANITGMAEASSASLADVEMSGSDFEPTLVGRSSRAGAERKMALAMTPSAHQRAWEDLAGIRGSTHAQNADDSDRRTKVPDIAVTAPAGRGDGERSETMTNRGSYMTAPSDVQDEEQVLAERDMNQVQPGDPSGLSEDYPTGEAVSPSLIDQRRVDPEDVDAAVARDIDSADRENVRVLSQRRQSARLEQRRAAPAMKSPRAERRSSRHGKEKSRYDTQLEDLLLLRQKALRASYGGHDRFGSEDAGPSNAGSVSVRGERAKRNDRSERKPRHSGGSSKTSRSTKTKTKLGFTMPDIMAWQAGLSHGARASSAAM